MARTCKKRVKNANRRVLGKAREFPKRNAYIITLSNGNQGAVTNRLQNEVASGKSVQETKPPDMLNEVRRCAQRPFEALALTCALDINCLKRRRWAAIDQDLQTKAQALTSLPYERYDRHSSTSSWGNVEMRLARLAFPSSFVRDCEGYDAQTDSQLDRQTPADTHRPTDKTKDDSGKESGEKNALTTITQTTEQWYLWIHGWAKKHPARSTARTKQRLVARKIKGLHDFGEGMGGTMSLNSFMLGVAM
ncbi:hypothetical protein DFH08DRAFT_938941 [Mycena albidolilacea]|uniref:Uncharacterized protein n=1 Tax=Mycena albidolilacea TaxID=1033008 RepID=A0AAD7EM52_9AGAR|nr:hypothetical protein DFH08DRAFT_938941 [Mycena albidolilacea]